MITEHGLYDDFEHYKKQASLAYSRGDVDEALDAMRLACILAKTYYLCYEDDELENLLRKIAERFSAGQSGVLRKPDKFVFYDTHTTDNIALTQQYLGALIAWDVDFVYITTKSLASSKRKLIARMLDGCARAEVHELSPTETAEGRVKAIREILDATDAGSALIQTTADDLEGCIAFWPYKTMTRYYLDISDHSFWIGATFFDRYIEFRSYGYNICLQHRKIAGDRVLVQPYYPILSSKAYKGLPDSAPGAVKVLSGGRIEKIYGMGDMYFGLVAEIIKQNPSVEFYYAGGGAFGKAGQTSYIEAQLKSRGIDERFHMLGFRDDLVSVIEHMDIYIGTYPLGGGLMTQLAASGGVPIVQYVSEGLSSSVDEFLVNLASDDPDTFVFRGDVEGFLQRVRELVKDPDERGRLGEKYRESLISRDEFDSELKKLIFEAQSSCEVRRYDVSCSELRHNQVDVENNCYHSYERIMVKSDYVRKREPLKYIKNAIGFVSVSDKRWLRGQVHSRLGTLMSGGGTSLS
jgi:hypothetical protein